MSARIFAAHLDPRDLDPDPRRRRRRLFRVRPDGEPPAQDAEDLQRGLVWGE
jgi:hypothetical protein